MNDIWYVVVKIDIGPIKPLVSLIELVLHPPIKEQLLDIISKFVGRYSSNFILHCLFIGTYFVYECFDRKQNSTAQWAGGEYTDCISADW